jgi:hypothetical protein
LGLREDDFHFTFGSPRAELCSVFKSELNKMATQLTAITTAEMRRRKADLESKLKELTGVSSRREELHIDYVADLLDRVQSSADREITVQQPRSPDAVNARDSIGSRENRKWRLWFV